MWLAAPADLDVAVTAPFEFSTPDGPIVGLVRGGGAALVVR